MENNINVLPKGTILHNGKRKYKVEKVLGTGGFGITYKVSSTVMVDNVAINTFFAMKEYFLSSCYRGDDGATMLFSPTMKIEVEQSLNDFITEAKRLNSLGHKSDNIVKVNEVFKENDTAYYIMEYLEGGNLQEYVRRNGALSETEAIALITPIAHAVDALHSERILHLDIKPENIVLKKKRDTEEITPVLIDFGLVKHFDSKGKPTTRLAAKGASDGFAPMEQYTTIDSFAPTLDVYALGATLYYLLKGKNPPKAFDVESSEIIASSLPVSVGEATKRAIANAMQKSKFDRTPSVIAFLSCWETKELEPSTQATKTSKFKNGGKQGNKNKKVIKIAFGVLFFSLLIFGVALAIHSLSNNTQETKDVTKIYTDSLDRHFIIYGYGKDVSFTMKYVEKGSFIMGLASDGKNTEPIHSVTFSNDFYIGETEVTQALWFSIMGKSPTDNGPQWDASCGIGDDFPAYNINYQDCLDFITKLNDKTGENFRLPTEAEWEYAAKGGKHSKGYIYSGSNNVSDVAWYEQGNPLKHQVKLKLPNELGLYDMSGNVDEYCFDWYNDEYDSNSQTDPTGPKEGVGAMNRVSRGGASGGLADAWSCRNTSRDIGSISDRHCYCGFRLVLDLSDKSSKLQIESIEPKVIIHKKDSVVDKVKLDKDVKKRNEKKPYNKKETLDDVKESALTPSQDFIENLKEKEM